MDGNWDGIADGSSLGVLLVEGEPDGRNEGLGLDGIVLGTDDGGKDDEAGVAMIDGI